MRRKLCFQPTPVQGRVVTRLHCDKHRNPAPQSRSKVQPHRHPLGDHQKCRISAPFQSYWLRICILTRPPGDLRYSKVWEALLIKRESALREPWRRLSSTTGIKEWFVEKVSSELKHEMCMISTEIEGFLWGGGKLKHWRMSSARK